MCFERICFVHAIRGPILLDQVYLVKHMLAHTHTSPSFRPSSHLLSATLVCVCVCVCFSSFLLWGQFVDVARNIDHPYEDLVKFAYRQDVNAKKSNFLLSFWLPTSIEI